VDEARRLKQVAQNELLLREANEEIEHEARERQRERVAARNDIEVEFFCACGRPDCQTTLLLTLAEYDAAHAAPNRFIVFPGHEHPDLERTVDNHNTYLVVEKLPSQATGADSQDRPETDE
jgi:hypothetical protein